MSKKNLLLLADDDPAVTESLAPFLERTGFQVIVVTDGAAALEKVTALHPDLVLLDVLMPLLDGREVLRQMRRTDRKSVV
jgi:DNA-binding response OmpR family regulator